MDPNGPTAHLPVEAIDRALRTLETLAGAGPAGLSLTELSGRVSLSKSTLHRTLAALSHRGFVARTSADRYALGPAALRLGDEFATEQHLAGLVHPALVALSADVGELVHLGVLDGAHVVYVDKVEPERAVRVFSEIGHRSPAVTTALGRAILAARGVSREALGGYLGAAHPAPDERSLWAAIAAARDAGYATEVEENEPGIACVGVALTRGADVIGAISVTAPAERMGTQRVEQLHARMREVVPRSLPAGIGLLASSTVRNLRSS